MTDPVTPIAVLVSGAGTNLAALIAAGTQPGFPAEVVLVLSNRPSSAALGIAAEHGVAAEALPVSRFGGDVAARDRVMRDRIRDSGARLVVCAGYDRIVSDEFLESFPSAILNIHPSLLPAFPGGMTAVEEALAYGVKVSGCTVHFLEPGAPDAGAVLLQAPVPVLEDDDPASLRQRIHEQEWRILPEAVALWCEGRLQREGRRVRILPAAEPAARRAARVHTES